MVQLSCLCHDKVDCSSLKQGDNVEPHFSVVLMAVHSNSLITVHEMCFQYIGAFEPELLKGVPSMSSLFNYKQIF